MSPSQGPYAVPYLPQPLTAPNSTLLWVQGAQEPCPGGVPSAGHSLHSPLSCPILFLSIPGCSVPAVPFCPIPVLPYPHTQLLHKTAAGAGPRNTLSCPRVSLSHPTPYPVPSSLYPHPIPSLLSPPSLILSPQSSSSLSPCPIPSLPPHAVPILSPRTALLHLGAPMGHRWHSHHPHPTVPRYPGSAGTRCRAADPTVTPLSPCAHHLHGAGVQLAGGCRH